MDNLAKQSPLTLFLQEKKWWFSVEYLSLKNRPRKLEKTQNKY